MTLSPAALPVRTPRGDLPVASFFALDFAISWGGACAVIAPHLLRGEAVPRFAGLMIFPVMLLGPALAGILFARRQGSAQSLWRRMATRFPARWLALLLVPPALVLSVLGIFVAAVNPRFAPNHFLLGVSFGVTAGLLEELGWTGYAFPALAERRSLFPAALVLGLLWSLWHLPAIDYLGAISPHGSAWTAYFLAFAAVMTAIRILICWAYSRTGSLLLAQLLHASSTGSLVVLSPARITAVQEAIWYLAYAATLWIVVAAIHRLSGSAYARIQK
ncbi:CPBP family intramembrane metalloprotease [Acidobacteria bacterium AB60]|nr:CPBP family intramembrane metalloprotease [Acidobacteria bacterium AB60]